MRIDWAHPAHLFTTSGVDDGMTEVKRLDEAIQNKLREIENARDEQRKSQPSYDFTDTLKTAHSIAAKYIIK